VIACGEPARPERAKVRQARLGETGKLSCEGENPQTKAMGRTSTRGVVKRF